MRAIVWLEHYTAVVHVYVRLGGTAGLYVCVLKAAFLENCCHIEREKNDVEMHCSSIACGWIWLFNFSLIWSKFDL